VKELYKDLGIDIKLRFKMVGVLLQAEMEGHKVAVPEILRWDVWTRSFQISQLPPL
jgi:hypothetical protein